MRGKFSKQKIKFAFLEGPTGTGRIEAPLDECFLGLELEGGELKPTIRQAMVREASKDPAFGAPMIRWQSVGPMSGAGGPREEYIDEPDADHGGKGTQGGAGGGAAAIGAEGIWANG